MNEKTYSVDHVPGIWGGIAVVKGSAIPVFMMEGLFLLRGRIEDVREHYPWLSVEEITSALEYADAHRDEIVTDRARHEATCERVFAEHKVERNYPLG